MLTRRHALLGAISASTAIKSALAYPAKQVTLVVPFAPGAAADGIARLLGTYLAERMGIVVVVENKAGGGSSIGLIAVSRSNPDGQTIGVGATGAIAVNPHVEGTSALDPLKYLAPISKLIDVPLVFVSHADTKLRTINDVVSASLSSPGGFSYGTTGTHSSQHLSIKVLKHLTGARLVHVPYRGSAPAVTDVLAGQVPLACVDLTSRN
ncbi:MAG: Bug family tripartite tricarboxylate transporter substrate binding protein [Pseudorhodoplanes sp.]|uniref:Bug family tripartite tricarboxylate transporter substrate binding protein n=1 Tax=Pseudorhodoplanes sp. TaxID=1934341 RepID=UPI003D12BF4D